MTAGPQGRGKGKDLVPRPLIIAPKPSYLVDRLRMGEGIRFLLKDEECLSADSSDAARCATLVKKDPRRISLIDSEL